MSFQYAKIVELNASNVFSDGDLNIKPNGASGSNGQFLKTDGSGNVSWATVTGSGNSVGATNHIQTADGSGAFKDGGLTLVGGVINNSLAQDLNITQSSSAHGINVVNNGAGDLYVLNNGVSNLNILNNGTGNLTLQATGGDVDLQSSGNLSIKPGGSSGSAGQALVSDGAGNTSWATVGGSSSVGSSGAVQVADGSGGFSDGGLNLSAGSLINTLAEDFNIQQNNTGYGLNLTNGGNGDLDITNNGTSGLNIFNNGTGELHISNNAGAVDINGFTLSLYGFNVDLSCGNGSLNLESNIFGDGISIKPHAATGSNGQFLTTDGSGVVSWTSGYAPPVLHTVDFTAVTSPYSLVYLYTDITNCSLASLVINLPNPSSTPKGAEIFIMNSDSSLFTNLTPTTSVTFTVTGGSSPVIGASGSGTILLGNSVNGWASITFINSGSVWVAVCPNL